MRVKFSSRRWGQNSPDKAPTTVLSLRQSLQDLSDEHAIDVIDSMGAVKTAHANPPAVMRDFCRRTLYSFQSALPFNQRFPSDSGVSVHEVETLILMAMPPGCFGFQHPSRFKLVSSWGSLPWRRIPTDLFL